MSWLPGWKNRIKLTIDSSKVEENLTDFPVLITLSSGCGISSADVTDIFTELTYSGRKKIAVTVVSGTSENYCYTEIEKWDQSNQQAWLWTKVPTITSGTGTVLYLYYDSAQADNVEDRGHLCIHSDDTDGSTTFTDSSLSEHSITANEDVHHETDQAKFGASSIYFDGTGDYLSLSDSDDWDFGEGEFTIDFWMRRSSTFGAGKDIISSNRLGGTSWLVHITNAHVYFYVNGGSALSAAHTESLDTWEHYAFVRSEDTLTIYVDGTSIGSGSISGTTVNGSSYLKIGGDTVYMDGFLDEIRIVKGEAAWTTDFTPPTSIYSGGGYVGDTGNRVAQNVWDSDFEGVYHLAQDPSGGSSCVLDSTSNGNHLTPSGMTDPGDLVSALVGKGLQVAAESDQLNADSGVTLTGAWTFSIILKMISFNTRDALFGETSYNDGRTSFEGNDTLWVTRAGNNSTEMALSPVFPTGSFALLTLLRDSSDNIYVYCDDDQIGSGSGGGDVGFSRLFDSPDNSGWAGMKDAITDEVRFSNVERSAAWIKADYYSCFDALLTFGIDVYPTYYFTGYVYEENNSNPVSRIVRIYNRDTGALIGSTTSSGNGYYYIETTYSGSHYLVALDDDVGTQYNLAVLDRMTPAVSSGTV